MAHTAHTHSHTHVHTSRSMHTHAHTLITLTNSGRGLKTAFQKSDMELITVQDLFMSDDCLFMKALWTFLSLEQENLASTNIEYGI